MEIDEEEYKKYLNWKSKHKYSDSNEYPKKIRWEKVIFKYNPYLSKGVRNSNSVKAFVKKYNTDNDNYNIQLQFWYGKTLYLFDVLDATESQEQYQKEHNIKK